MPVPERTNKFFQLDVHLCKPQCFDWETTIYTYGGLWHVLGCATICLGFTINDAGFHLRVAEIEETHPKDCLLRLTYNPVEAMTFLDLDKERFAQGFVTLDDVFAWISSTRFFHCPVFKKQKMSVAKRPMYLEFIKEWLPKHPDVDAGDQDKEAYHALLTEEALEKL